MKRFSKDLKVFKPVDIQMIVDLDSIIDIEDEDTIKENEVCQLNLMPSGQIYLGYFNKQGNGHCLYIITNDFKEEEHFKFV